MTLSCHVTLEVYDRISLQKWALKRQETCDIISRDFGLVTFVKSCHNTVNARKYPPLLPPIKANHSFSIIFNCY